MSMGFFLDGGPTKVLIQEQCAFGLPVVLTVAPVSQGFLHALVSVIMASWRMK